MASVEFDEENAGQHYLSRRIIGEPEEPKLVKFLISKGITKSERQSYYLLIALAIVIVLIALGVYLFFVADIAKGDVKYNIPQDAARSLPSSIRSTIQQ